VSLSEVSKKLHRTFIPARYEKFVVSARERSLDRLEIPSPVKTYFRVDGSRDIFNSLSYVKDLQFIAPIHTCQRKRCYHDSFKDGFSDDSDSDEDEPIMNIMEADRLNKLIHDDSMKSLSDKFRYSFFHLPKNSLRSFAYVVVKRPD
jgi:hypothetical protein